MLQDVTEAEFEHSHSAAAFCAEIGHLFDGKRFRWWGLFVTFPPRNWIGSKLGLYGVIHLLHRVPRKHWSCFPGAVPGYHGDSLMLELVVMVRTDSLATLSITYFYHSAPVTGWVHLGHFWNKPRLGPAPKGFVLIILRWVGPSHQYIFWSSQLILFLKKLINLIGG